MRSDEGPFRAMLATTGRRTSREHRVELLAVRYRGDVYFSRHRPDSDWFKNALANPHVSILYGGRSYSGVAEAVMDEEQNRVISGIKYPGQEKANEARVSIRVRLHEP